MMRIIKGRSYTIDAVAYSDYERLLVASLGGAAIKVIFKYDINDTDANAILTPYEIGTGVTVTLSSAGEFSITIPAADTAKFQRSLVYMETVVKLSGGVYISNGIEAIEVAPNLLKTLW